MTLLDELFGDIDADGYVEVPCPGCGRDTRPMRLAERPCRNRRCVELACDHCGANTGGWGPVGCRCEVGGPNPLSINGHELHRRQRTRGRRR